MKAKKYNFVLCVKPLIENMEFSFLCSKKYATNIELNNILLVLIKQETEEKHFQNFELN